ncbi:uncharacterized protein LOC110695134 [Chenopodium quinoa]|uniref:uncharacterized protein LOC110695134 n=1 Tax=Chenopodium quinoa TaxID=63459 RepID=UPI000B779F16|nr:uncharacterized protein LOC110695134 [Chenopodium quinoa]
MASPNSGLPVAEKGNASTSTSTLLTPAYSNFIKPISETSNTEKTNPEKISKKLNSNGEEQRKINPHSPSKEIGEATPTEIVISASDSISAEKLSVNIITHSTNSEQTISDLKPSINETTFLSLSSNTITCSIPTLNCSSSNIATTPDCPLSIPIPLPSSNSGELPQSSATISEQLLCQSKNLPIQTSTSMVIDRIPSNSRESFDDVQHAHANQEINEQSNLSGLDLTQSYPSDSTMVQAADCLAELSPPQPLSTTPKPKSYPSSIGKQRARPRKSRTPYENIHDKKRGSGSSNRSQFLGDVEYDSGIELHGNPMRMSDVVLMDRACTWKDWDKFDPLLSLGHPVPNYPDLNMKVVMWNVKGASRNEFIPHAWDVIAAHKPSIFILLETKSDGTRAAEVSKLLGFDHFNFIKPNGLRGGIWLLYKDSIELIDCVEGHSRNYFHALFKFSPEAKEVLLTAVHAPSAPAERHKLWNDIQASLPPDDTPWLFLGDLNEVTSPNEKTGGRAFRQSQCNDLNRLADAACLVDLGFSGEGLDLVRERLDRALGNPVWLNTYPNTQASTQSTSDPIPRQWAPPHKGYFKLNTDGSWVGINDAGGGGVLRCDKGLWQLGYAAKYNALSPAATELLAIKDGLLSAWAREIKFLELETDAAELKRMLEDPDSFKDHELGNIIRDVASILSRNWKVSIFHVSRCANGVADKLAAMGRTKVSP